MNEDSACYMSRANDGHGSWWKNFWAKDWQHKTDHRIDAILTLKSRACVWFEIKRAQFQRHTYLYYSFVHSCEMVASIIQGQWSIWDIWMHRKPTDVPELIVTVYIHAHIARAHSNIYRSIHCLECVCCCRKIQLFPEKHNRQCFH